MLGLLRRTGPATAELLDPETGEVFGFNFESAAEKLYPGLMTGEEWTDRLFGDG